MDRSRKHRQRRYVEAITSWPHDREDTLISEAITSWPHNREDTLISKAIISWITWQKADVLDRSAEKTISELTTTAQERRRSANRLRPLSREDDQQIDYDRSAEKTQRSTNRLRPGPLRRAHREDITISRLMTSDALDSR